MISFGEIKSENIPLYFKKWSSPEMFELLEGFSLASLQLKSNF